VPYNDAYVPNYDYVVAAVGVGAVGLICLALLAVAAAG
jgi:hypothetical protein